MQLAAAAAHTWRCSWRLLSLLVPVLVLLAATTPRAAAAAAGGASAAAVVTITAPSTQPLVLQNLINTSVAAIQFATPTFAFVPDAWAYVTPDTPLVVGPQTSAGRDSFALSSTLPAPGTVLDLVHLDGKVALSSGHAFKFDALTLINARTLSAVTVDLFLNSPGATVVLSNVVVVDAVCNATDAADDLARFKTELPQLPGRPRNLVSAAPVTCVLAAAGMQQQQPGQQQPGQQQPGQQQQVCFTGGVLMQSLSVVLPPSGERTDRAPVLSAAAAADAVARGSGMVFTWRNATRVCRSYLDPACLQQHGGNASLCWQLQVAALQGSSTATGGQQLPAGGVAGVVIGAVAAAALVAAAVLIFARCRRTQWQASSVHKPAAAAEAGAAAAAAGGSDLEKGRAAAGANRDGSSDGRRPGQEDVHLGVLLGAGSFGRVFKGTYHGQAVAVKVLTCLPSELPRVLQEAEIAMQLDNPHVVRALRCLVRHSPHAAASSRAGSSGPGAVLQGSSSSSTPGRDRPVRDQAGAPQVAQAVVVASSAATTSTADSTQAVGPTQSRAAAVVSSGSAEAAAATSGATDENEIDSQDVAEVWLVLELANGGTLKSSVKRCSDGFDLARLLCRLSEVASGMAYLHSRNIIHSDLKASNVLLVNSIHAPYGQVARISDFGLARILRGGSTHHSTQCLATISHCAPEVLQHGRVSFRADVYAFGVLMWELCAQSTAYKELHYGTIVQRVLAGERPPIPHETPEELALLMERCWAADPEQRPTFVQIQRCLELMLHSLDAQASGGSNALPEDGAVQQQPEAAAACSSGGHVSHPGMPASPAAAAQHPDSGSRAGSATPSAGTGLTTASAAAPVSAAAGSSQVPLSSRQSGLSSVAASRHIQDL